MKYIIKCLKCLGKCIKRVQKILVRIAALTIVVSAVFWAYDYYTNTYIPEKLLTNAIADIESKFNSKNDSVRLKYAFYILSNDYTWGYENVDNIMIKSRLRSKRKDAFAVVEENAYAGDSKCQYMLGKYYYQENDYSKAAYWWNEAALQNYTKAFNDIGIAYKNGIGVHEDMSLAIEWIKKGAEAGDKIAQRNYGDLFEGRKINRAHSYEEDIEQAKYWWKKAAAQGDTIAKERLQHIYNAPTRPIIKPNRW